MKSVLLVDDSKFMRTILRKLINGKDYFVLSEASNGFEAVEQYVYYRPDIVIMDITMPNMNGLEALKSIIEKDPQAKVVMCSALGQQYLINESLKLGAKGFIIKPYFDNILYTLQKIVSVCSIP
ncbi:response regulator [Peribacillus loiseleuriae]|uniref:response regulator n=1 Tax=Peribacillus loiseleuriae TaxID=1679170 RepID=UPI003D05DE7C